MQNVFWTQGAKVSKKSFAPPKTAFAPVQNAVAPVQEQLCSLGPKDLLHPPLSTFGNSPFSVNFPGPQLPNNRNQITRFGALRDSVRKIDGEPSTALQGKELGPDPPFHAFFPQKRGLAEKKRSFCAFLPFSALFLAQKRLRSPVLEFSTHACFVKTALS